MSTIHILFIASTSMVGVAQLVEHRIVAPEVVGSIPIVHPNNACVFIWAISSIGRAVDS